MGKYRERKNVRFQNTTLQKSESDILKNEYIAGFPPFLRGYNAMGHLLTYPQQQAVSFWSLETHFETEKKSDIEYLFTNQTDYLFASECRNKAIIIDFDCNFLSKFPFHEDIKRVYVSIDNEKEIQEDFFDTIPIDMLEKLCFFIRFTDDTFQIMEKIRKTRACWANIMQKKQWKNKIPIASFVKNIQEQIYAYAIQTDIILYDCNNSHISDPSNALIVEFSAITKTIDPFWK